MIYTHEVTLTVRVDADSPEEAIDAAIQGAEHYVWRARNERTGETTIVDKADRRMPGRNEQRAPEWFGFRLGFAIDTGPDTDTVRFLLGHLLAKSENEWIVIVSWRFDPDSNKEIESQVRIDRIEEGPEDENCIPRLLCTPVDDNGDAVPGISNATSYSIPFNQITRLLIT